MQWREWLKTPEGWRFKLDAKSGPLESGDFGKNAEFGTNGEKSPGPLGEWRKWQNLAKMENLAQTAKNRQSAGNIQNAENIQTGCQIFI